MAYSSCGEIQGSPAVSKCRRTQTSEPQPVRQAGAFVLPEVVSPPMRVCAEPGCPILCTTRRCTTHTAQAERDRGTRQQRGYDAQHEATRAALLPKAHGTLCPLCGEYMYPHQVLHLDHSTPLAVDSTSRGDRITHARCNLSRGAGHSE